MLEGKCYCIIHRKHAVVVIMFQLSFNALINFHSNRSGIHSPSIIHSQNTSDDLQHNLHKQAEARFAVLLESFFLTFRMNTGIYLTNILYLFE